MAKFQPEYIFFMGIGGIGMSALARFFHSQGKKVGGYDKTSSPLTEELTKEGMVITYQDDHESILNVLKSLSGQKKIAKTKFLVVRTPAIPVHHEIYSLFEKLEILVLKRAEVLGFISQSYYTIAVAGTHGKTTTSTMIAHLLHHSGVDIQAFLGGISANYQTNYISGDSQFPFVVVEADEFDRSFLHLTPDISIITSTDADHLDIYGNHQSLKNSFIDFTHCTRKDGILYIRKENDIKAYLPENYLEYSIHQSAPIRGFNLRVKKGNYVFDWENGECVMLNLTLGMAGLHNVENAVVAIAVCMGLGLSEKQIREGLKTFKGVKRRFEKVAEVKNIVYIDDYAHHPEELKMAIRSAKELYPGYYIIGVFQPHLYSRTRDFSTGFATELDTLDECLLMEIYPAREEPISGVTSDLIASKMLHAPPIFNVNGIIDRIKKLDKNDKIVVMTLGAGDIDRIVPSIKMILEK